MGAREPVGWRTDAAHPTLASISIGSEWTYTDARHIQRFVTGKYSDGSIGDVTRVSAWQISNTDVLTIPELPAFAMSSDGRASILANIVGDGTVVVTATCAGKQASRSLTFPLVF